MAGYEPRNARGRGSKTSVRMHRCNSVSLFFTRFKRTGLGAIPESGCVGLGRGGCSESIRLKIAIVFEVQGCILMHVPFPFWHKNDEKRREIVRFCGFLHAYFAPGLVQEGGPSFFFAVPPPGQTRHSERRARWLPSQANPCRNWIRGRCSPMCDLRAGDDTTTMPVRHYLPYPCRCHPERSEGSAVASESLRVALLPSARPHRRNLKV